MDADRKKLLKVVHVKPRVSQESIDEELTVLFFYSSLVVVQLAAKMEIIQMMS